jgi:hypothetical protein
MPAGREERSPDVTRRLEDGILELNAKGQLIGCNPAAKHWLMLESRTGEQPIQGYIRALIAKKAPPKASFIVRGRLVRVTARTFAASDGSWRVAVVIREGKQRAQAQAQAIQPEPEPAESPEHVATTTTTSKRTPALLPHAKQAAQMILDELELLGQELLAEVEQAIRTSGVPWLESLLPAEPEETDPEVVAAVSSRLSRIGGSGD